MTTRTHPRLLEIEDRIKRKIMGDIKPKDIEELINVKIDGEKISSIVRKNLKVSINELSEHIGVSAPTLRKAMHGQVIRKELAKKICKFYKIELITIAKEIKGK